MAKKKKKDKKGKKEKKGKKAQLEGAPAKVAKEKGKKGDAKKGAKKSAPAASKLRALARKIVDATSSNDEPGMLAFYAESVESTEMNMPPTVGLDALRSKFEGWNSMVSNPKFKASNVWIDGNTIVIEWLGDVTISASGRQAQMREIAIHEIKDGKIVRERYYYDPSALQP